MVSIHRAGPGPDHRGVLWWSFPAPRPAVSSASVGGGLLEVSWVINIGVERDYRRTDLGAHADQVRRGVGLAGRGTALFTAAEVSAVSATVEDGVRAWSTVGVTRPTWPADRSALAGAGHRLPGTINTVVVVGARLGPSALVQAALTAAEAKAQACLEAGIPGTGTASDAVVVVAADTGAPETFGGVRSPWGSRVALAVHASVAAGLLRRDGGPEHAAGAGS